MEIATTRPKCAPLWGLLGQWQLRAGNLAEARKAFETAKSANAKFVAADISLAELDYRENRPDAARQRLTAVVSADPKNVPALLLLANLEEAAGNRAGSITRYRSVLGVESSNVLALNNLAYTLAGESPDETFKYAQQAAEIAPDAFCPGHPGGGLLPQRALQPGRNASEGGDCQGTHPAAPVSPREVLCEVGRPGAGRENHASRAATGS